jgi:outer membrane protein OmpA-like peptidoglycan-associated protein
VAALAAALSGCGAAPLRVAILDDVEHVRQAPGRADDAALAPEAYARAEQEREYARAAHAASDDVGATLHAERAIAAYGHARAVARYARATSEADSAQKSLDDASTQEAALDASRARLQAEADELEAQVRLSRDRLLPAASTTTTPEREAARGVAARSLRVQARLLCGAARLIAPEAHGLADAEAAAAEALPAHPADRPAPKPADPTRTPARSPVDDAARARTRCLELLTTARRESGYDAGSTDALLAELSAAGGWDPSADERGVLVTLRGAFHGSDLTDAGAAKLKDLGLVAAAHPRFGVQVVVHDAQPTSADVDAKRAQAAVHALVAAGADATRVHVELAGPFAPLVDPADPVARSRNERLEVVFVGR